ncbi:hypothetical protein AMTRI_Chr06g196530 [Amborella trichopoda]
MYLSEKQQPIDFYKAEESREMIMEAVAIGLQPPSALQQHQQQQAALILTESSGEDHEVKAPKKRAETWIQEEIRTLIGLRREMDTLFNTSKSNKHLWEQISSKMREKGFDRSPTMCTDKWRNLLKEYKKSRHHDRGGSAKVSYYKELEDLFRERARNAPYKSPPSKVDSYMQFADKGFEDAGIPFGSVEGGENHSTFGRVILVSSGDYSRRIGVDGTAEAIKEAIKSAFGLRTKRTFWLEDEDGVVRSLDRDMPLGTYTLHLDEGLTIKVYDDSDRLSVRTEEKTLYTEDDFRDFLTHRGWTALREFNGFKTVDSLDELRPNIVYQGLRLLGE